MEVWPYPAKNPVLISSGQIIKTCIPVLVCTCGTANYPDVTPHGLFPVHNKCLITVDFLVEIQKLKRKVNLIEPNCIPLSSL